LTRNPDDLLVRVFVDGDACPRAVLQILLAETKNADLDLVVISSFNHPIKDVKQIIVGNEDQAVDIELINRIKKNDIVVTQDWGLAAMVLAKGAKCIAPNGQIYLKETIDFMLEERHIKAKHRKGGGRTKGPSARTKKDDEVFLENFKKIISHSENS